MMVMDFIKGDDGEGKKRGNKKRARMMIPARQDLFL